MILNERSHVISVNDLSNKLVKFIAIIRDYLALMKLRVMSLVVFTAIAGIMMAPGHIHPRIAFIAILCIMLGSGASAVINMWYERDIDAMMKRTMHRPIVTGKIAPKNALSFGVMTGFFSVLIMALCVGYVASFLLLIAILFYVFIYTIWLKRISIYNIVIGGAAGAFPPMIGWAAVTGDVSFESFLLFLLIFTWTPAHFWALALYQSEDYKKCNIPMMPIIKGDDYTKKQIVLYTILTIITSILPAFFGMNSALYAVCAALLGSVFLFYALALQSDQKNILAPRLFFFSIFYLFIIFSLMILDHYLAF